jgi:hypothetical protein
MFNKTIFNKNQNYTKPINELEKTDIITFEDMSFYKDFVYELDIEKIKYECKKNKVYLTKVIDGKRTKKSIDELKEELLKLKL